MRVLDAPHRPIMAALAAFALLAAACTDGDPPPEPIPPPEVEAEEPVVSLSASVGVVLPPADRVAPPIIDAARADLQRLGHAGGTELGPVQAVVPDAEVFSSDLGRLLTERGTSLVCVLGDGAVREVRDLADRHPELRFCAAPIDEPVDLPDAARGIEVRAEELGHLVGAGVRASVGGDGRVGVVLGGGEVPTARFRAGLLAALDGLDVEVAEVRTDDGVPDLRRAVEDVLAEDVDLVVLDGAAGAAEAAALAAESVPVALPTALLRDGVATRDTVVSWRVRWDEVLAPAVRELVDDDRPLGPWSVGLAEGALTANVGPAAGPGVRRAVERVRAELADGSRDPLAPPPTGTPSSTDASPPTDAPPPADAPPPDVAG